MSFGSVGTLEAEGLNTFVIMHRNKAAVVAAGGVPLFVELLKAGANRACKEAAVAAFQTLSCLNENKACIGSGAIPLLVQLLISGSNQGRKDALTTLYNLTILLGNKLPYNLILRISNKQSARLNFVLSELYLSKDSACFSKTLKVN